jgi:hypothetical protein
MRNRNFTGNETWCQALLRGSFSPTPAWLTPSLLQYEYARPEEPIRRLSGYRTTRDNCQRPTGMDSILVLTKLV